MKKALMFIAIAILAMACAPSPELEIASINRELALLDLDEYCDVSISDRNGEREYLVDTPICLREDNFEDAITAYCFVMGSVGRAIESDAGILRVGTESLWIDMDMEGVHRCLDVANSGGNSVEEMDKHLVFVDR